MPTLSVSDKCTLAISKLNQVRSKYSTWYTGGLKDQPLVDCSDALEIKINQMKSKAENGVQKQVGGNGPVQTGGATACTFDSILNTKAGFSKWASGVKKVSDGDYVDHINEELSRALANNLSLSELRTTICDLVTYTDSKLTKLDGMFGALDGYLSTVQKFMNQSSMGNIAISCSPIIEGLAALGPAANVYNPDLNVSVDSLNEAKAIVGDKAKPSELKQVFTEKLVANSGIDQDMEERQAEMDTMWAEL